MTSNNLPPLNSLKVFDAVVRSGGFGKAAADLNMTRAAVSYQIRLLENRLGTSLFERTAQGAVLTPVGSRFAARVALALRELRTAMTEIGEATPSELALSAVTNFGHQWLIPRLGDFQARSGIRVRLETTAAISDLNRDGYDIAIRNGYGAWPGLRADHLIDLEVTPLVAPQLLDRVDVGRGPEALLGLPLYCLYQREWAAWLTEAGARPDALRNAEVHEWDCWHLVGQAALNGLGAALLFPFLYRAELASGRLVQPFEAVFKVPYGYWLAYPEDRATDQRILSFRDWLYEQIELTAEAVT